MAAGAEATVVAAADLLPDLRVPALLLLLLPLLPSPLLLLLLSLKLLLSLLPLLQLLLSLRRPLLLSLLMQLLLSILVPQHLGTWAHASCLKLIPRSSHSKKRLTSVESTPVACCNSCQRKCHLSAFLIQQFFVFVTHFAFTFRVSAARKASAAVLPTSPPPLTSAYTRTKCPMLIALFCRSARIAASPSPVNRRSENASQRHLLIVFQSHTCAVCWYASHECRPRRGPEGF